MYKWLRRYDEGGDAALAGLRPSRPIRMPQRAPSRVEQKVLAARRRRKRGAVVLTELVLNPSTVGRILARHEVPHLSAIDIAGESVRSSAQRQPL